MPHFGAISRRQLIRALRRAGPESGGAHEVMWKGTLKLTIPNPHSGDIGKNLPAVVLREAGISRRGWERL